MIATSRPLKICLSAGEHSGDILGAGFVEQLLTSYPTAEVYGITGPKMAAAGCRSICRLDDIAVMGIREVLTRLPTLWRARRRLKRWLAAEKPDIFIGIDAANFNLPLAHYAKRLGIMTVQYVSPKIWVWRAYRIHFIKRVIDLMLCIMPFEEALYAQHHVTAKFIGHPLADVIPATPERSAARQALQLDIAVSPLIALLPGSREQEIQRMLPVYLDVASACLKRYPQCRFVIPVVSEQGQQQVQAKIDAYPIALPISVHMGGTHTILAAADAAVVTSGTASLEAALFQCPQVVAYKTSALSYHLVKILIANRIRFISLPNLMVDDALVPELIQEEASSDNISAALFAQLEKVGDPIAQEKLRQLYRQLRVDASSQAVQTVMAYAQNQGVVSCSLPG